MKLVRYGPPGDERPGVLDAAGEVRALPMLADLAGAALDPERLAALARIDRDGLPRVAGPVRFGPCVGGVGKIVCAGLNYRSLAAAGFALPAEPVIFLKAASAICGPDDPLELPPGTAAVDWEVELAVVIGRRAQRVAADDALAHVAGYCVINDLSARDWQFGAGQASPAPAHNGGQWDKGKNHDGFAPLGPWLVTANEVAGGPGLSLWLDVDGERLQEGDSRDLLFDVPALIAHISRFMTLNPGDVIATGTPPGSGFARQAPRYLAAGQCLRAGISGLGVQTRRIVAATCDEPRCDEPRCGAGLTLR